jgi:hypothetical protein
MHLYLDYQDGAWPEIHTVTFAKGTHEWEQRTITVKPTTTGKNSYGIVRIPPPKGTVWFDDLYLAQGKQLAKNLLTAPALKEMQQRRQYCRPKVSNTSVNLISLKVAGHYDRSSAAKITQKQVSLVDKRIAELLVWMQDQQLHYYWSREIRDLSDIHEKLQRIEHMIANKNI